MSCRYGKYLLHRFDWKQKLFHKYFRVCVRIWLWANASCWWAQSNEKKITLIQAYHPDFASANDPICVHHHFGFCIVFFFRVWRVLVLLLSSLLQCMFSVIFRVSFFLLQSPMEIGIKHTVAVHQTVWRWIKNTTPKMSWKKHNKTRNNLNNSITTVMRMAKKSP